MSASLASGLRAEGLCMRYGAQPVLRNLSLPLLAPGRVHALIGPNAAGKSTLLRGLAGLQRAQGRVWLDGEDISGWATARRARRLVYLPQSLPTRTGLAVFEAVLSAAMAGGERSEEALAGVESALRRLDLLALADRPLASLSGGQRQLVGLAQALVRRPRALLLDEPTSALDLYHQHLVLDRVRHEARAQDLVVLAVLHDLHLALACADQVLVLDGGTLITAGPPGQVIDAALLARVYRVDAAIGLLAGRPALAVAGAL
ncbi:ABC transporter ATP-binding protein [Alicycliphilus sp. T452]|jgi:iron complex transport system ATP-binding protein